MKIGKPLLLSLLGAVVVAANAVTVERPMPDTGAIGVHGAPQLFWNVAGENLLSNGGFEQGAEGWSGGTVVTGTNLTTSLKAVEGTNYYRVGPSTSFPVPLYTLAAARTETLPATSNRITWSFPAITLLSEFRAAVVSTNQQIVNGHPFRETLLSQTFTNTGSLPGWTTYSVDLSAFAGQTVQLELIAQVRDGGISLYIDDVRLTVQPPDVAFDVYLDGIGLGRTTNNWWDLKDLSADRVYQWRVDAIAAGATNRGAIWNFRTAPGVTPKDIAFAEVPARVCPNTLTTAQAFVRSADDLRMTSQSVVRFSAFAEDGASPGILISEIDTGVQDAIELINVSTNTIDMNGWKLQIYGPSNSVPFQSLRFPTNAILDPGQICTIVEGVPTAWPQLGMSNVNWGDTGVLQAGVVLQRPTIGNVVADCVFIDLTPSTNTYHNIHLKSVIPGLDWRSDPITNVADGLTYQRVGSRDLNVEADWNVGPASIGSINTGLIVPFELSFGNYPADLTLLATVKNGIGVTKQIIFPRPAHHVQIFAQHFANFSSSTPSDAEGLSPPFDVVAPEFCLALLGPAEVRENDGSMQLHVTLAAPAVSDVTVHLRSSHPLVAMVPETLTIPAGATEGTVTAEILDNNLLEGRKGIAFFAEADNYTPAVLPVTIDDDEFATLTFIGPLSIVEGAGTPILIQSSRAPNTNVVIQLSSDPVRTVSNPVLAEGATTTSFQIFDDAKAGGDLSYHFKAEFQNWIAGEADIFIDDATSTALSVALPPRAVEEGNSGTATISLTSFAAREIELTLSSSDPTLLEVTNKLIIPMNESSATFSYRVLQSDLPAGVRMITLTASAPGFDTMTMDVPIFLYPPAPRLNATLTPDGFVVVTFNADPAVFYGVLDLTELPGGLYDGITAEVSNGIGRFTFPVTNDQHYFFVTQSPK